MSDKINKLSQAIRLGSTFHPQCRMTLCTRDKDWNVTRTCALGAAAEAAGLLNQEDIVHALERRYPSLLEPWDELQFVKTQIARWNDDDRLTREEIARRLEEKGL